MSINTYDEQKFWEEVDILFPDIVKAITSLAKKSYISITNLRNGVTWWSEKAMEYFGMRVGKIKVEIQEMIDEEEQKK